MQDAPIGQVLQRLENFKLRENGRARWRACCPAHGGRNPTALSIGLGDDGRVLLKCWHGCGADEVAGALGLELQDLFPPKPRPGDGYEPMKYRRGSNGQRGTLRRGLLTASQALDVLSIEVMLVVVCAADMARGKLLDDDTRGRLLQAAARVNLLIDEVRA